MLERNSTELMLRNLDLHDIADIVQLQVRAARLDINEKRVKFLCRGIFARIARDWTDASWPEISVAANMRWQTARKDGHANVLNAANNRSIRLGRFSPQFIFDITTRCEAAVITGTIGPCHAQPPKPAAKGPAPCKTQDLAPKDRIRENRRTRAGSTPARGVLIPRSWS